MKSLYVIACCFLLAAIVSSLVARHHFSVAMITLAKSMGLGQSEQTQARQASKVAVQAGSRFSFAGLVAAGLGLGSWFASFAKERREGKRLTPVIPLGLLIVYVLNMLVTA
jgi:hypothetical protein